MSIVWKGHLGSRQHSEVRRRKLGPLSRHASPKGSQVREVVRDDLNEGPGQVLIEEADAAEKPSLGRLNEAMIVVAGYHTWQIDIVSE